MVATTISDISTSKTIVLLCNPTRGDIKLKKDMNVGICQQVTFCVAESTDNIDINQISLSEGKMQSIIQNSITVPEHLEVLFEQSITNLEKEEQLKLLEALLRYQDVFARPDNDLGRTGQVSI